MASYKRAVILGASGGIGAALARAVEAAQVIPCSRRAGDFDLLDEASIAALANRIGEADFICDATGALELDGVGPEKSFAALDPGVMARQMAVNAIGPALIFKHFMKRLPRERRGVIVTLSARVGSIGDNRLGGWISYRAAKAALNQILRGAAIELGRTHGQALALALHPGTVRTPLTEKYVGQHPAVMPDEAAANLLRVIDGLGPSESGGFYDWQGRIVPW